MLYHFDMSRRFGVLLILSALQVLTAQNKLWVDSQGNKYEIDQSSDTKISVSCPDCKIEGPERVYDLSLKFPSMPLKDRAFEGSMTVSGGSIVMNGSISASGLIRVKIQIPGLEQPFDFALMSAERAGKPEKTKPNHIVIERRQASALIGKWVPLVIYLADADGRMIVPDKEILVQVEVQGGTPIPALARITPESPKVPLGISPTSKSAKAKITVPGVPSATALAIGCEAQPAADLVLKLNAEREHAFADGRDSIPVVLTLVDANDTPATDGNPKQVGFEIGGVGRLASSGDVTKAVTIAAGQCAEAREIVSDSAGQGKASAEFRGKHLERTIVFRPALTMMAILMTLGGGLIGGFVAAGRNYASVRRWKFMHWFFWLVAAMAGAVAIYLAYFYGLLGIAGGLPGGAGFGMFTGLIGGYLGAEALNRLAGAPKADVAPVSAKLFG